MQKITHQDVGQMDMYIRMYDELKRSEGDNPTIGIVLCSDTDEDIAKYSILHGNEQLFASKYKLYLPTEEELRAEIENQKTMFYLQQQENNETKKIRLKKIRIEKSELSEEENALTAPILKDKSLIHEIYKIFVELLNERGCPPNIDSVTQRKKFIFIILYLFSPSSLAGGKMTAGLRPELARVLGVQSECTISDNCADVVFLYQNYGDFSGDIEYLYTEIVNRLRIKGLIN